MCAYVYCCVSSASIQAGLASTARFSVLSLEISVQPPQLGLAPSHSLLCQLSDCLQWWCPISVKYKTVLYKSYCHLLRSLLCLLTATIFHCSVYEFRTSKKILNICRFHVDPVHNTFLFAINKNCF